MPSIGSSFACKIVEGRFQSEIVFPHSMAHLEFRVQRREGPIEVKPRVYLVPYYPGPTQLFLQPNNTWLHSSSREHWCTWR